MVDVYHALIGFLQRCILSCIDRISAEVNVYHALIGFFFFTKNNVHHAFKKKEEACLQ